MTINKCFLSLFESNESYMIFKYLQGHYLIFCLLTLAGPSLLAQDSTTTKRPNFVEGEIQNDAFYIRLRTDRYFTSGLSLKLQTDAFTDGLLGFGAIFPLQFQDKGAENYYQLQIVHQLFSPYEISWTDPSVMDRPYAAVASLRFSNQTVLSHSSLILKKEIQLGWVGPSLNGEMSQNTLHQMIGRPTAQGWDYQIADGIVYGLNFGLEKGLRTKQWDPETQSSWLLELNSECSNLSAKLEAGLNYQLGNNQTYFAPAPLPHHRLQWYVYFKALVQLAAYNQLIDGHLSPSNDGVLLQPNPLQHLLVRGDYGIVIQLRNWECQLSYQFLSPEIKGASAHYWGSIRLRRYF